MRVASEIQSWGEGPTSRESPYRVCCTFEALAKQNKNSSAQGSLKSREVSNSFWEGTRREKTRLKKVSYLVSQSDENMYFYMWLYCTLYKFLEVQIMHI